MCLDFNKKRSDIHCCPSPQFTYDHKVNSSIPTSTEDLPPRPIHRLTRRHKTSLSVAVTKSCVSGVFLRITTYPHRSTLPELVPSSSHPILSLTQFSKTLSIQVNPDPMQSWSTDPPDTSSARARASLRES